MMGTFIRFKKAKIENVFQNIGDNCSEVLAPGLFSHKNVGENAHLWLKSQPLTAVFFYGKG